MQILAVISTKWYNLLVGGNTEINYSRMQGRYAGQYVATQNSRVVVHDRKGDKLFKKLEEKGISPTKVTIAFIPPKKTFFSLHAG